MGFLVSCSEFKELLNDIVSEHVRHETVGGREYLLEHELLLSWSGSLELLLDKPGAVLVLTKLHDMVGYLTQLQVGKAVVPAIDTNIY